MLRKVDKEQLKVPAHIDYLGDLRDFVTQIGKKHNFSAKVVNAFKLAVDEASTNIIRHAYREHEGHITIRAIVKKNSLTISLIDQGTFFDPQRVKDPDLNRYIDIGKKGGLGIFIMRKLMDEIDYRKTEEGNELRITKYRETSERTDTISEAVATKSFAIKGKFFFRTIAFITFLVAGGYGYVYFQAEDIAVRKFISSAQINTTQLVNRLSAAVAGNEYIDDKIGQRIYEDYGNQIYRLSVEDGHGFVEYTSNPDNEDILFKAFSRPSTAEIISDGVFRYVLNDGERVYEFEREILIKGTNKKYGKAHIFISASSTEAEISASRMRNLKLAMTGWGATVVFIALLIYLLMSPLQKLSEWIKDLGHGEISDEMDIDSSSEIGEIAQAFSDITYKFRESQRHLADQERLQKEMQVAQDIQQTLLPVEFPELEGYEISSYYEAAKEVGGDYYDFVEVDKDTLGIAVADVSGKGVPGSLVMTMIRTALRTEARGLKDAAEVLARVNEFVSNDIKKGMFVTIFYLIIDSKRRRINYASAGHNPMILYRGSTRKTYYLNPKGFPIGIQLPQKDLFRKSIQSETIQLAKDDILLVYTDGITEAMNPARQLFGEERLLETIREYGVLEVNDFVENLKNRIYSFTEGNQQYDDISLVSIKEKSTREEDELRRAKEAHRLISQGYSIREAFNSVNLTTYAYYNKYKKIFEQGGLDTLELDEDVSVEAKHLSIEEKTKILDIIANNPEYGPGRISEELNTEKYHFTEISESKIYDELVRSRLNTRQLREAYINKRKRSNRRPKPPGTPLMTLDGKLIVDRSADESAPPEPHRKPSAKESAVASSHQESTDKAVPAAESSADSKSETPHVEQSADSAKNDNLTGSEAESLLDSAIDELLAKGDVKQQSKGSVSSEAIQPAATENSEEQDESPSLEGELSFEDLVADPTMSDDSADENGREDDYVEGSTLDTFLLEDISFEQLFDGGADLHEETFEDEPRSSRSRDKNDQSAEPDETPAYSSTDGHDDSLDSSREELFALEEVSETPEGSSTYTKNTAHTAEAKKESGRAGSNGVSFADLLQAIDEEIVYVKEGPEKVQAKRSKQLQTEGQEEVAEKRHVKNKDLKDAVRAKRTSDGEPQTRLSEREEILVEGIKHYKKKDYENAIREFQRVIESHPDYKEAHSILGNAYFRNQMYEEAAQAYARVKEIDSHDISAYENMGVIYANRGEMKLAIGEWKRVLELSPEREDIASKIKKALRML